MWKKRCASLALALALGISMILPGQAASVSNSYDAKRAEATITQALNRAKAKGDYQADGSTVTFNVTPLGANVLLLGSDDKIEPNPDGSYSLSDGVFHYIVSQEGYEQSRGTITINGQDLTEQVSLNRVNNGPRAVTEDTVRDRIYGGWVGQLAGVVWGANTEFKWPNTSTAAENKQFTQDPTGFIVPENKNGERDYEGDTGGMYDWLPYYINNPPGTNMRNVEGSHPEGLLNQDDIYIEIPWLQTYENYGVNANWDQLGNAFLNAGAPAGSVYDDGTRFRVFHGNGASWNNINNGITAPESGYFLYTSHASDISYRIHMDSPAMMAFGMPSVAQEITWRLGHVIMYGDGVYGGTFVGAMYAAAGTAQTWDQVIRAGIEAVPENTQHRYVLDLVYNYYTSHPNSTWEDCWMALMSDDIATQSHCASYADNNENNIDSKLNSGYVLIGLLYGEQDMDATMRIATRCGQDSDCNPSSAGGVLGYYLGLENIAAKWYEEIDWTGTGAGSNAKDGSNFYEGFPGYTPGRLVEMTCSLAAETVAMAGGNSNSAVWTIPDRATQALIREQYPDDYVAENWVSSENSIWKYNKMWTTKDENGTNGLPTTNNIRPEFTTDAYVSANGNTITFHAAAKDSDDGLAAYQWFFGDLSYDAIQTVAPGKNAEVACGAVHTYQAPGTYEAYCYVTDQAGHTNYSKINVVVGGTTPAFTDVKESDWYYDAVKYVYENQLMTGISANQFGPDGSISRAMFVQCLYNLEGRPEITASNHFTDVNSSAPWAKAVNWASSENIVAGISKDLFAPEASVTREQMSAILYRYAQNKGCDVSVSGDKLQPFQDGSQVSSWAVQSMNWAVSAGLLADNGRYSLNATSIATRTDAAWALASLNQKLSK